jgi:F-type H+-transporting ATPase subunit a
MAESHDHDPLSHVLDHATLEWPGGFLEEYTLPKIYGLQITRFMVMELVAAVLMLVVLIPLARHIAKTKVTRGRFWNIFEAIVVFIRNGIARPAIDGGDHGHGERDHGHGHDDHAHEKSPTITDELSHDTALEPGHAGHHPHRRLSDSFLPFLWTLFFFVLFCNLLGMIPGGASATGNINVTGALALLTLGAVLTAGIKASGPVGFWINIVPRMDVPAVLKPGLWILMFFIEVAGLLIRHVVLAVRLFANMLAGHIVLAVILGFIALASGWVTWAVTPGSLAMVIALSFLELFVAFLQAYIFTFLAALFIGSAAHPH